MAEKLMIVKKIMMVRMMMMMMMNYRSKDEIHEKNSRIHLDRLQNKYTNCKGVKNNNNFGQIAGIQEKLDTTCK